MPKMKVYFDIFFCFLKYHNKTYLIHLDQLLLLYYIAAIENVQLNKTYQLCVKRYF